MSPSMLQNQLEEVGKKVRRWKTQVNLAVCAAGVLAVLWLSSLSDLIIRYNHLGRGIAWVVILLAVGLTTWWVRRILNQRFTPQGVAAMIEKKFPELDNRLINYLQFAADNNPDVFKQAYVKEGPPAQFDRLDFEEMKDRRSHKRARWALIAAVVMLVGPALFFGQAWAIAMYRVVNPFADVKPASLTSILEVSPGETTVLQGDPLVLTCKVQGRFGHKVHLDIDFADKDSQTHLLGKIKGGDVEEFSYRVPKVNTEMTYRFRAGDAAFPKTYEVKTRPPLAFDAIRIQVTPPAYTKLPAATYDGLNDELSIPMGAQVELGVTCNLPATHVQMKRDQQIDDLVQGAEPTAWTGRAQILEGTPLALKAVSELGDKAEHSLHFGYEPDEVPTIHILAPEGRPVLTPGTMPSIEFSVADDFGLAQVHIEQVAIGGAKGAAGKVLRTFRLDGGKDFISSWTDETWHSREEQVLAYRIVAKDNCPFGDDKRVARSPAIVFHSPSAMKISETRKGMEKEAFAALSKVIEMQRENIAKTKMFTKILDESRPEHWQEAAARQKEIRETCKTLLTNPLNPLGSLSSTVKKLYLNEMSEVIPMLASILHIPAEQRPVQAAKAIAIEEKILRQLTLADSAAAKASVKRRVSALTTMLAQLIRNQGKIRKDTQYCVDASAEVGDQLIDRQDELAMDFTDFVKACEKEASEVIANDENYASLLNLLASQAEELKIRGDMVAAADKLDQNKPAEATPPQDEAIRKLKIIQAQLDEVLLEEGLEDDETLLEQIVEAQERMEKISDLYKKAIEQMEMVAEQKDKDTKETDMLEEEYEELVKNLKEAMLQIPTDLHVFMELNVANDIVEDVFSIFEEIEQTEESKNLDKDDIKERALAKREEYLEGMEEAKDRLDDMEQWLDEMPDHMKITAEAFDQEEMPEAGIALGALETEASDLIGDLLDKDEEMAEEADDGAINTSVPDMVASDEVKEGDVASFAAQGKSGNETPDHKEQDGRSNVGRQGMAVGETAAGSGTINEGDNDIEERRTQDPTQSGQIDVDGEDVKTAATGGGKQGTGKADEFGMEGGVERMDSTEEGSAEGMEALAAERAEAMHAKASMQNLRTDSFKEAAHHLRQAEDAVARGNIAQLKEHRKMAIAQLKKAKAQIAASQSGAFSIDQNPSLIEDVVEGGSDQAPAKYRDLVAEYYKSLNKSL